MENYIPNNYSGQQRRFPDANNFQLPTNMRASTSQLPSNPGGWDWEEVSRSGEALPAGINYQLPMNLGKSPTNFAQWGRVPQNAFGAQGAGGGWAGVQPMATVPSADFDAGLFDPRWLQEPITGNSGCGMCCQSCLGVGVGPLPLLVAKESTQIPFSMPMAMPAEPKIEKKTPKRWSREEHKLFLIGLNKFKKGDWKSISRDVMKNKRSPTQVASHAQKYYKRQKLLAAASDDATTTTKKKRSSIHDTRVEHVSDDPDEIKLLLDMINAQPSK